MNITLSYRQLKNAHREVSGKWHVRVTFPPYPSNLANVDWYPYLQIHSYDSKSDDDGLEVCETFAVSIFNWIEFSVGKVIHLIQTRSSYMFHKIN